MTHLHCQYRNSPRAARIWLICLTLLGLGACSSSVKEQAQSHTTSNYVIGTKQYVWQDNQRTDQYYGKKRLVNSQVWYPCIPEENSSTLDYYYRIEEAYTSLEYWSEQDLKQVRAVETNAILDAALSTQQTQYPLVVFSPSLGGNLSQYTFYAEYLAKKGYIILGINHLYESEYVVDLNDSIILANLTFHDSLKQLDIPAQISADDYRAAKGPRQRVLGEDIVFAIDQILGETDFRDRIDTSRISVFGHSIGGAGAIYASMMDQRIKAVIDLDGTPPSEALKVGISVPFMFIEDLTDYENHEGYAKLHKRRNDFCTLNSAESWRILIADANHNSFLDIHYFLAEGDRERQEALQFLSLTAMYMEEFLAHTFRQAEIAISPLKTDRLEILYFDP